VSFVALYPLTSTAQTADFRLITLGSDPPPTVQTRDGQAVPLLSSEANPHSITLPNQATVNACTFRVGNQQPDTEVVVRAMNGNGELARATARTLPDNLTGPDAELRAVLASCYCRLNKASDNAGRLFKRVFSAYGTPHLKIWCGDQVYLDSPADVLGMHDRTPTKIADSHLTHYVRTWSRDHLGDPLARGANVFTPDDHEYWNNAPFPNVVVTGLFDEDRRTVWQQTARDLLDLFQGVPGYLNETRPIDVPPVSILVLDTRSARVLEKERRNFMTQDDEDLLREWVLSLASKGPGILVLGQPLFLDSGTKWFAPRMFEDFSLADYRQFERLLAILNDAPRDILILSGDVHYSRLARMLLPNDRAIWELINSPLALVVGLRRSKTDTAQKPRKVEGAARIGAGQLKTISPIRPGDDSIAVLSISRHGLRVRVKAEFWRAGNGPGVRPLEEPAIFLQ
jgi:hypothetical protein